MILTITEVSIDTLDVDDVSLSYWAGADIADSKNRIGEKKKASFYCSSDESIASWNIFINPGLFLPVGYINNIAGKGSYYWSYPIDSAATAGTYTCSYQGTGGNEGKNILVKLEIVDSTTFIVHVYFYQIYDLQSYLNPNAANEAKALLRDRVNNTQDLESSESITIYTDNSIDGRIYIYMEQQTDSTNNTKVESSFGGYKAGFYAKDEHEATPYFSNPNWQITGNVNNKLNTAGSNLVEFYIEAPPTGIVSKVRMWIIRTSEVFSLGLNFLEYYDYDLQKIVAGGSDGTKIIGPYTTPTYQGSNIWKCSFYVDPAEIDAGAKYRFIALVYQDDLGYIDYEVNSFISDEIDVNSEYPYDGTGFNVYGYLDDYQREFDGNYITCVIEERMRSRLVLNFTGNQWADYIFNKLGLVVTNDIRRYLTKITFQIYDEYYDYDTGQTVRNIFDERIGYKVTQQAYTPKTGLTLTFGSSTATFSAEWRNRHEEALDCIRTEVNGTTYGSKLANQYWGGTTKYIDWKLTFYYDDFSSPFTDEIVFTQIMTVKDYDDGTTIVVNAQDSADDAKTFWCPGDDFALQGEIVGAGLSDLWLMTTIEPAPGSISIEEAEAWAGAKLSQQTTPKIINQEDYYGETTANKAKWTVDYSQLVLNTTYKICAIAKYVIPAP